MRPLAALACMIACGAVAATAESAGAQEARENPAEALAQSMEAALVGEVGPALALTTLDGQIVDLEQSYGRKPIYLKMWATWCGPCRRQMPHLEATYERLKDEFTVIGVATGINESEEEVRAFVTEQGLTTPMAIDDGRLAQTLNLRVTPAHVVIGRDGRVLHVGQGADEELEAALLEAAAQPPVAAVSGGAPIATETPSQLPGLSVTTVDGEQLALAEAHGQPTAMLFFLPWCEGYYAATKPELTNRCGEVNAEVARRQAEGGARWIGVASGLWETQADVVKYRDDNAVQFPLVLDDSGDVFRSFGVRSTPVILIFGADGELVARVEETNGEAELQAALDSALDSSVAGSSR